MKAHTGYNLHIAQRLFSLSSLIFTWLLKSRLVNIPQKVTDMLIVKQQAL